MLKIKDCLEIWHFNLFISQICLFFIFLYTKGIFAHNCGDYSSRGNWESFNRESFSCNESLILIMYSFIRT
jgi:hypothetical protein